MPEQNNTAIGGNLTPQTEGKTFSQDELNRIVSERLAKDRAKAESELAKREQELNKREFLLSAKDTLTSRGYTTDLLDALNCADSESLAKSLDIIDGIIAAKYSAYAESAARQNEDIMRGYGVAEKDLNYFTNIICHFMTGGKTFEQAAKEFFVDRGQPAKRPAFAMYNGAGKSPFVDTARQDAGVREAMGLKT